MNVKKELYATLTMDQVVRLEKVDLDDKDVYTWIKTIFLTQCYPEEYVNVAYTDLRCRHIDEVYWELENLKIKYFKSKSIQYTIEILENIQIRQYKEYETFNYFFHWRNLIESPAIDLINFLKLKLDLKLDDLNQFDHKLNIEKYLFNKKHLNNIEEWKLARKNLKKHPFEDDFFSNDIVMHKEKKKVTINEEANTLKEHFDDFLDLDCVYEDL
jgi:hypothetical protein